MHQFTVEKLPDRFKHYFTCFLNVHTYSMRNSFNNNLSLPRYSTNKTLNCLKYIEPKIWNDVVSEKLKKLFYHKFKSAFKRFLLTKYE